MNKKATRKKEKEKKKKAFCHENQVQLSSVAHQTQDQHFFPTFHYTSAEASQLVSHLH